MSKGKSNAWLGIGVVAGAALVYVLLRRAEARRLPPAERAFSKRFFTPISFQNTMAGFLSNTGELRRAMRGGKLGRAFGERIMLVVSQVNGCRSCSYAHTRFALREGVPADELYRLADGDLQGQPEGILVALLFAQHYAETGGNPESATRERLEATYGKDGAREVRAYIRLAMMTSLFNNTLEAIWSRLLGRPAAGSALSDELSVMLGFPAVVLRHYLQR
ncbi:MAG: carboxymuconolactone decarboxylase family protein [Coprothermobacterota bacterium]|nr:carboxymuconolactone decarboxylase family protein [Coprothermobacterota bacterium]